MALRRIIVCHTVPPDESGGGQRSAQLARAFAARGLPVDYVYLGDRFDFTQFRTEKSTLRWPLVTPRRLAELNRPLLESMIDPDTMLLVEAPHPAFEPIFDCAKSRGARIVFELIDAWDSTLGAGWFDTSVLKRYVTGATTVTGSARVLVAQLQAMGRTDAVYVPNAADAHLFDSRRVLQRPREVELTRRALVYVGSLTGSWIGWHYIVEAAKASPEALFYLVGDAPSAVRSLGRTCPNLRFPGLRPIEEVPAFLAHADVALLPFLIGKVSDAVSPIKVFEYLAMGKRVVSTPLPELQGYPNITIARTSLEFARVCRNPPPPEKNARFLDEHTWDRRVDQLIDTVGEG